MRMSMNIADSEGAKDNRVRSTRLAYWISKATSAHAHAHSNAPRHPHTHIRAHTEEYVIITVLPRQERFREGTLILLVCLYVHCLSSSPFPL